MTILYQVDLPWACFGVRASEAGEIERNEEIGTTLTYPTIKALRGHVERCGGTLRQISPPPPLEPLKEPSCPFLSL